LIFKMRSIQANLCRSTSRWLAWIGHGVERFRINCEGFIGFLCRVVVVVVFERQVGEQLLRFDQFGIELDGLLSVLDRFAAESVGRYQARPRYAGRVFIVDGERFLKSLSASALLKRSRKKRPQRFAVFGVLGIVASLQPRLNCSLAS
jgi:hypothetical protein